MKPTKQQLAIWDEMREIGCILCGASPHIHHIETGMGRRKNHDRCIPLCHNHHQGKEGIHTLGRKAWQAIYGTEQELHEKVMQLINGQY